MPMPNARRSHGARTKKIRSNAGVAMQPVLCTLGVVATLAMGCRLRGWNATHLPRAAAVQ